MRLPAALLVEPQGFIEMGLEPKRLLHVLPRGASHVGGALLRDPQRAAEMGRAAREYVEQTFGLEAHLDETLRFYEECRRQPQARVPSVDSCAQWSAT